MQKIFLEFSAYKEDGYPPPPWNQNIKIHAINLTVSQFKKDNYYTIAEVYAQIFTGSYTLPITFREIWSTKEVLKK